MSLGLPRRASAEYAGTAILVAAVVGSGIAAARLSPTDVGLQLLENAIATALALGALILTFGPVSGAHFNPVVSAVDWWYGRRAGTGLTGRDLAAYSAAQTGGAITGAVLADLMFDLPAVAWSRTERTGVNLWLAEAVATAGLVVLIFALARSGRTAVSSPPSSSAVWSPSPPSSPGTPTPPTPPTPSSCPTAPRRPKPDEQQTRRPVRLPPQRRPLPDGRRLAAPPRR
ncbi:aquaporin [Micromonospora sp. NPDC048835]|uniref:aquaporin n=1 Tax=Micromonospora sp. NPDC048835 TaxID=3155147 RepID=UPI0033EBD66B